MSVWLKARNSQQVLHGALQKQKVLEGCAAEPNPHCAINDLGLLGTLIFSRFCVHFPLRQRAKQSYYDFIEPKLLYKCYHRQEYSREHFIIKSMLKVKAQIMRGCARTKVVNLYATNAMRIKGSE